MIKNVGPIRFDSNGTADLGRTICSQKADRFRSAPTYLKPIFLAAFREYVRSSEVMDSKHQAVETCNLLNRFGRQRAENCRSTARLRQCVSRRGPGAYSRAIP
jgi:hypothetical protein